MYFYSDNKDTGVFKGGFDFSRVNATNKSLEHYSNMLMLEFFLENEVDFRKKFDIEKEIKICDKKITWWKNQWNFNQVDFVNGVSVLKKKWGK